MEKKIEKLIQKIEETGDRVKFGKATFEITYTRGKVAKVIIKDSEEVVLL